MMANDELKPCRRCGAQCSVQQFDGLHAKGVLYMCSALPVLGGSCASNTAYVSAEAWNDRTTASPTGDVGELERYGVNWKAPNGVTHEPMADGYWTPWHIAADAITALHARVQELEAKWVEMPGVE